MLYIKDTSMLVAGVAVPGLVKKLEITGAAVIDAVTDDNNVTLGYQPNGYEPLKMNVDLLLEPSAGESVESMVQTIQLLFKPPGQTAAIPLPVVNSQAAAWLFTTGSGMAAVCPGGLNSSWIVCTMLSTLSPALGSSSRSTFIFSGSYPLGW